MIYLVKKKKTKHLVKSMISSGGHKRLLTNVKNNCFEFVNIYKILFSVAEGY